MAKLETLHYIGCDIARERELGWLRALLCNPAVAVRFLVREREPCNRQHYGPLSAKGNVGLHAICLLVMFARWGKDFDGGKAVCRFDGQGCRSVFARTTHIFAQTRTLKHTRARRTHTYRMARAYVAYIQCDAHATATATTAAARSNSACVCTYRWRTAYGAVRRLSSVAREDTYTHAHTHTPMHMLVVVVQLQHTRA